MFARCIFVLHRLAWLHSLCEHVECKGRRCNITTKVLLKCCMYSSDLKMYFLNYFNQVLQYNMVSPKRLYSDGTQNQCLFCACIITMFLLFLWLLACMACSVNAKNIQTWKNVLLSCDITSEVLGKYVFKKCKLTMYRHYKWFCGTGSHLSLFLSFFILIHMILCCLFFQASIVRWVPTSFLLYLSLFCYI